MDGEKSERDGRGYGHWDAGNCQFETLHFFQKEGSLIQSFLDKPRFPVSALGNMHAQFGMNAADTIMHTQEGGQPLRRFIEEV